MAILFDPNCLTLAEHFLQDEPYDRERANSLARSIQQAVEDWFFDEGDNGPAKQPDDLRGKAIDG